MDIVELQPANLRKDQCYVVVDAATDSDCATGLGTIINICCSDGISYFAVGDGAGAGSFDLQFAGDSGSGVITDAETFTLTGGNGIVTTALVNDLNIVLDLNATLDGVGSTSNLSGLEFTATAEVALLQGCADNQILKWEDTGATWDCAADADTQLTTEAVEDIAGALVARGTGTHTGIAITYQDGTDDIDFIVDHDGGINFVADEHVAHTGVVITAGTGLTGGGDISVSRTIDAAGGDGIIANANDLAVDLNATIDGVGLISSLSGMEFTATNELALLQGCADTEVLVWENAGATWDCGAAAAANHDILSATHTDTLAAAVSRGSTIIGNATPDWSELVVGAANLVHYLNNATDVFWGDSDSLDFILEQTTVPGVSGGIIIDTNGDNANLIDATLMFQSGANDYMIPSVRTFPTNQLGVIALNTTTNQLLWKGLVSGEGMSVAGTDVSITFNMATASVNAIQDQLGPPTAENSLVIDTTGDGVNILNDVLIFRSDGENFFIPAPREYPTIDGQVLKFNATDDDWEWATDIVLTQEEVEDFAGALVANATGTHTGIAITYQDATADIDFIVDHDGGINFVADEHVAHTGVVITAGTGLTGGGDISVSRTIDAAGGDGIIANANDLAVDLNATLDGVGLTSSLSGMEFTATAELALLQGCANNEVLQWNDTPATWDCAAAGGGGTMSSFDITDTDASPILTVNDGEQIQYIGGTAITVVAAADGSNHDVTFSCDAATLTTTGCLEQATQAEADAGTAGNLAVIASVLEAWNGGSNVVTVGTITTGVWNGTALTDAFVSDTLTIGASSTVAAGAVGADHIDAMSEIAAAIKRGPDATDTHLLTTDVAAPGALTCLNMDTDGSVVLAAGACAAAGGGDVDDVGPGCATGACWTNAVTTTGTTMWIWEGTVDNTDEFTFTVPADPDFDVTWVLTQPTTARTQTFPDAGGEFSLLGQTIDLASAEVTGILPDGNVADTLTIGASSTIAAGAYTAASIDGDDINTNIAGDGLILTADAPDTLDIDLNATLDGVGASSNLSGMEFTATAELALLQGCADNQILKWNDTPATWDCEADATAAGMTSFDITDTDASPILTVNDAEQIQFIGGTALTVVAAADGSNHDVTFSCDAATATTTGCLEHATQAEADAGTAGNLAVIASVLEAWNGGSNIVTVGTITTGVWNGTALTDAFVSDTLTASLFVGSGSTTTAIDLATAEVAGVLPDGNVADTLTIGASSTIAAGAYTAASIDGDDINANIAGDGLILTAAAPDTLDIDLNATLDGVGLTSSLSGMEFTATAELALLQGCANNQILKWVDGAATWDCAADADSGGTMSSFDITDTDASPILTVNDGEQIQYIGGTAITVIAAADGANHDVTFSCDASTATTTGCLEQATQAEADAGTAGNLAVIASVLEAWNGGSNIATVGTIATGVWNGTQILDAFVSDTLTSSLFVGSGSTTTAIDLATAEVAGILPDGNVADTLTIGASSTIAAGAYTAASIDGDDINANIAGNGLILTAASPDTLDIDLNATLDGVGLTTSLSGMEFTATSELALLQGCANNEILKWVDAGATWDCAADADTGGAPALSSVTDPVGDVAFTFDDGEEITWTMTSTGPVGTDVFHIDFNQPDDADATDDIDVFMITMSLESGDPGDTIRAMKIVLNDGVANTILDAGWQIINDETTPGTIIDAIRVLSPGVDGGIIDAIDASAANIDNALNMGANNIVTGSATISGAEMNILDGGILISEITTFTKAQLATQTSDVIEYAEADGQVWTGVHDFGGATSLEIVNGAAPVVDTLGEIAVDTTDVPSTDGLAQLLYHDGGEVAVLTAVKHGCFDIEGLLGTDDNFAFWSPPYAVTIRGGYCYCNGTCTNAGTIHFEKNRAGVITQIGGATPTGDIACSNASAATEALTDLTSGTLTLQAFDQLRFDVITAPTTPNGMNLCFTFTVDRQ